MKEYILILVLILASLTMSGQNKNQSFFNKYIIDKTGLSDIDPSLVEWNDTVKGNASPIKFVSCKYIPTEEDFRELGYMPEWIKLFFYEKDKDNYVLGAIRIFRSFNLEIEKDYNIDKSNKNKMLVETQDAANTIRESIQKGETIIKKIGIIVPFGRDKNSYLKYDAWRTNLYDAKIETLYSNWTLARKYKDMERSWSEGGELLSFISVDISSRNLNERIRKEIRPDAVDFMYDLLDKDDISEYIDEESEKNLDNILKDARNNIMEEPSLKKALDNDMAYIPESLKVATPLEIEKYSWVPVTIAGQEIIPPDFKYSFHVNIHYAKQEVKDDYSKITIEEDTGAANRFMGPLLKNTIRNDIEVEGQMVSGSDGSDMYKASDLFHRYLDEGSFSMFFDDMGNLVFANKENERHKAIFKRVDKIKREF